MGYTTEFQGQFELDKPLTEEHANYLTKFSRTRHMKRDRYKLASLPDPLREAVGLPLGKEGQYYLGENEDYYAPLGEQDSSVINHNSPPDDQPGLWCGWTPTEDRQGLEWDGIEKFYNYVEWLEYLIEHFLIPWGYQLDGEVSYQGEEFDDRGTLIVKNNRVTQTEKVS